MPVVVVHSRGVLFGRCSRLCRPNQQVKSVPSPIIVAVFRLEHYQWTRTSIALGAVLVQQQAFSLVSIICLLYHHHFLLPKRRLR